jgi:hypothetical protein
VSYIVYDNAGAIRSQPLSPELVNALAFLQDMGLSARVFSGGQEAGSRRRTGSTRHDDGNAADVFFYRDGQRLDWANPEHLPVFQEIVRRGRASGLTGFGAGEGYMQPGSMHVGFGAPAVWGAGGRGSTAPEWLREAFGAAGAGMSPGGAYPGQTQTPGPGNALLAATQPPEQRRPVNALAALDPAAFMSRPFDYTPAPFQVRARLSGRM